MAAKPSKKANKNQIKVRDLKPKKDVKGGVIAHDRKPQEENDK